MPIMNAVGLIVASLVLYPLLLVVVGRWVGRRADNDTFFTADRRAPWYLVWPAMISAAMSGITFVSVPGSVASDGFTYLQMVLGFTVGQLLLAFWLVPLFYRMRMRSIYEYFDRRFSPEAHRAAGVCFLVAKLLSAAFKLYIVVVLLQQLIGDRIGLPYACMALMVVGVVWGYTRSGGVKTLLSTDLAKTTVMLVALGAMVVALARQMMWSPAELCDVVGESPYATISCWDWHSERCFWRMFPAGVLLLVAMTGLDQDLMQRNLACRSVRDAQKNVLFTAVSQIVVIALLLVLGVLLYTYADATGIARPDKADQLFARVALADGFPWWAGALFLMGFSAGSFSSGGAALTALTTSVTIDLVGSKGRSEQALMQLRRRIHALLAVVLVVLLLLFDRWADESVINLIYKVAGYTYGPLLGMFLFGCFSHRRVAGRGVWIVALLPPLLSFGLQEITAYYLYYRIGFELLLFNALMTMVGMWMISRRATA